MFEYIYFRTPVNLLRDPIGIRRFSAPSERDELLRSAKGFAFPLPQSRGGADSLRHISGSCCNPTLHIYDDKVDCFPSDTCLHASAEFSRQNTEDRRCFCSGYAFIRQQVGQRRPTLLEVK